MMGCIQKTGFVLLYSQTFILISLNLMLLHKFKLILKRNVEITSFLFLNIAWWVQCVVPPQGAPVCSLIGAWNINVCFHT